MQQRSVGIRAIKLYNQAMSTTEAAKILGVTRMTVFNRIRRGDLEYTRRGNRYVLDPAVVEAARQAPGVPVRIV